MRNNIVARLLAGTALTLMMAVPTAAIARPDRVESSVPPPPMLNGHRSTIRRNAPQTPPQATSPRVSPMQHRTTIDADAAPMPPAAPRRTTREPDAAPQPVQQAVPLPAPRAMPAPTPVAAPAAAEPAPAPAAADSGFGIKNALNKFMASSDSQVSDKLRAIVTAKQLDKLVARPAERKEVETFYAGRNYAPLWLQDGEPTARAKAVIARLKNAGADGLDPADYPVPQFGTDAAADAEGDIVLTNSVLDYARHLAVGRVAPTRVTAEVDYGDHTPAPAEVLRKVSDARDVNAVFNAYDPQEPAFAALKAKLAGLRARADDNEGERIAEGPAVKPGARDARIPQLRARLGVKGKPGDTMYDRALYNTIRRVQHNAGMNPSGIIDNKTLAQINGPTRNDIVDKIAYNMERWRWLPRDLGRTYVMVNVPDYTLKVMSNGRMAWTTKIVAGKPQTPTPLVTATMEQVIVNPSWYVPQSIIQNELLPAYETDPNIFERMGLEVKRGPDGHINVVQPPGAANALGRIKFTFPNKFQVYLHDTPEKRLFAHSRRAFSHGCMRVEDPTKFGEVMLSLAMAGPTPNARQINQLFDQEEKIFKLTNKPMVHLTYQTAFVDEHGKLQLRDDIYGFDQRIHAILHGSERRIADVPPPPDPKRDLATLKSNQEILRRVERREAANPFVFFERLFR